jgi:mono/diheme cytochrome c family protein
MTLVRAYRGLRAWSLVVRARTLPRSVTGLFGAALALSVAAAEPELTVNVAGRVATYAPAALLGLPNAATITIPQDVAYKRAMSYHAVPMATLLSGVAADESIRFVANDGFVATLFAAPLLAKGDGAVAYLAVETSDTPWPPLRAGEAATAGPFYLVWTHPDRGGIVPEQWPYQIARIESVAPLSKRYPALAPAPSLSARDPAWRGFAVFETHCITCHTLNLGGDASLGPDLNVPYSPTEYMRVDALRRLIRDPQSLRRWPRAQMPAFAPGVLSDRELNDLLAYLRYMADRKVAVPVAK